MSKKVPTRECRKRLSIVWFTLGGLLMLFLILKSLSGGFGEGVNDVWAWFLPTLMPTFSLIVGVLALDLGAGATKVEKHVDRLLYRLALWLSVVYLVVVALPIFIAPLVQHSNVDLMKMSHLWLGPLQGLVAGVVGAFFLKGEERA